MKQIRPRIFLDEMQRIIPWGVGLFAPCASMCVNRRPPFPVAVMLRIHFMQQWFGLSDPAMEEALHGTPIYREFVGLDAGMSRIRDETTILRFRRLLKEYKLAEQMLVAVNGMLMQSGLLFKAGTVVDATLIPASSSTKNNSGERDSEIRQGAKKQGETSKKSGFDHFMGKNETLNPNSSSDSHFNGVGRVSLSKRYLT